MQEQTDSKTNISALSLSEQIALRNRLDESIDDIIELTAAHAEKQQIEEMERRLADFKAGKTPTTPWAEFRKELASKHPL